VNKIILEDVTLSMSISLTAVFGLLVAIPSPVHAQAEGAKDSIELSAAGRP
jgi:hypothetical protein